VGNLILVKNQANLQPEAVSHLVSTLFDQTQHTLAVQAIGLRGAMVAYRWAAAYANWVITGHGTRPYLPESPLGTTESAQAHTGFATAIVEGLDVLIEQQRLGELARLRLEA